MNVASRMESTAPVNRIHVTPAVHHLLPGEAWQATGGVEMRGTGIMETYVYAGDSHAARVVHSDSEGVEAVSGGRYSLVS